MHPYRRALVPVDFSAGSVLALREAARLVGADGEVHLCHVLPHLEVMHPGVAWETIDDASRVGHTEAALAAYALEHGVNARAHHVRIAFGNPASEIAELAHRIEADLVVVSSHGRTGLVRLALGSVAERVVRLARCPVLVVRMQPEA